MDLEKKLFDMKVNYILENFGYDEVIKVMKFLDWKWGGIIEVGEKELREKITYLFSKIYKKRILSKEPIDSIGTGGLKCSIIMCGDSYRLQCEFVLSSWDTDCYEDDIEYRRVKNLGELINM